MRHEFSLRAQWADENHPKRGFSRNVDIQADGPGEIAGSAARAFHGDKSRWNPEQLILAALTECHILSYLFAAGQAGIQVKQISVRGTVFLEQSDVAGKITSAVLRPEVILDDDSRDDEARKLHDEAHKNCFIANSINFPVHFQFPAEQMAKDLPKFSNRLGAPIAVLSPRQSKKPSQVTGLENRPGVQNSAQENNRKNRPGEQKTFYDQVGGHETFAQLSKNFYAQVAEDEDFKAMYPEEDLGPAEERLRMFLEQYWGGPTTYSERRGHPRLRMRHQPFHIGPHERDTWLKYMRNAVESLELSEMHEQTLWDYLERAAHAMQNAAD